MTKYWNHCCLVTHPHLRKAIVTKDPDSVSKGPLTVAEVTAAESVIVKAVQHDAFPDSFREPEELFSTVQSNT